MTREVRAKVSGRRQRWRAVAAWVARSRDQTGVLFGLLLLITFSLLSPPFRRIDNLMLILLQSSFLGIVAAGQTMVVLTGGIDLSVGSAIALTGVVAALLMKEGLGPMGPISSGLAILMALSLGALIGLIQGLLIAKRGMPPFIVTLGSLSVLRGAALVLTNAASVNALPDDFKWVSDAYVGILPMPSLIMLAVFLVLAYVLRNTKLGRYTYAIGGNETSARLSGVPVDRYRVYVYVLSGFLAAVAGIMLIARIDGGVYTTGEGYELSSVAAVIIGGTSLGGGVGGVWGTLVGVLILAVVSNGLVMLSISPLWRTIVSGSIILLAVFIDVERRRAHQAAPKVHIGQAMTERRYLDEMMAEIAQLVERHLGSLFTRLYLLDPGTDELLECQGSGQKGVRHDSIASQVWAERQPVVLNDIAPTQGDDGVVLSANARSALAIPLTLGGQMIGVLEVQSVVPHGFDLEAVTKLTDLIQQDMMVSLRDAWLLECGWLARQIRQALRNLWDDVYLGQCALAEWLGPEFDHTLEGGPAARGLRLRQLLMTAIEDLKPERDLQGRPAARRYEILRLAYVEGCTVNEVAKELNVSRRQYFYDQRVALDSLAYLLVTRQAAQ